MNNGNAQGRGAPDRRAGSTRAGGKAPVKKKYYRRRHRLTLGTRIFISFIFALLALLLIAVAAYSRGYRYVTVKHNDGGLVRFAGKIDRDSGKPLGGRLFYSSGAAAKLDESGERLSYSDGSVYVGELDDFYREGSGTLTLKNGDEYTGEFKDNVITGKGVYSFSGGDVYEGDLIAGVKEGTGKYTYANGDVYEGGFVFGLKCGKGSYLYSNGDKYVGDFEDDMRQGEGTYTWAETGETYTGSFYKNNMHGYGTYTWQEGRASYTGYFENGKIVAVKPGA